jgi:4-amino-4-deoxy-L-arabinose transferase-like glycosyltransferase
MNPSTSLVSEARPPVQPLARQIQIALFFTALFVALFLNGQRSLWDTSETRYAEASREMVASQNWLYPQIEGHPHLTKPPLTYWVIASTIRVFGTGEWAVRLGPAFSFAFAVLLTALLTNLLLNDPRRALFAGLLQMLSPLAFFGAHVLTTDTFVAVFVLGYFWAMWNALLASENSQGRRWALLMHFFLVLAFLTKGPPAWLPAGAAIVFLAINRSRYPWRRLCRPEGITLLVVGSLVWYAAVLLTVPNAMAVWREEALQKVFVASNRNMPAVNYLPILLGGVLPSLIVMLISFRSHRLSAARAKFFAAMAPPQRAFLSLWVAVPFIVFCLSRTRLPLYVLPLAPAFAITAAAVSPSSWFQSGRRGMPAWVTSRFALVGISWIVVLIGIKAWLPLRGDTSKDMRPVAAAIRQDSQNQKASPHLMLTMPRMGSGLLYYLDGPPTDRLENHFQNENNLGRSRQIKAAFSRALPEDVKEYIVLRSNDVSDYERFLAPHVQSVFSNSEWTVWRRNSQQPVQLKPPVSPAS